MTVSKLQGRHISILMALQEDPMMSVAQLAEKYPLSQTTLYNDLKWLSGDQPDSTFRYFRVVPNLNEDALGLETLDLLVEVPEHNQFQEIEEVLDNHPYTSYRIRTYGATNGLFVQFRIPHGTSEHIATLLENLRDMRKVGRCRVLPSQAVESIYTVSRLKNWDLNTFSWSFDLETWRTTAHEPIKYSPRKREPSRLDLLEKRDIKIMCELTRGASSRHQRQPC